MTAPTTTPPAAPPAKKSELRWITPVAILSFPHLFEPWRGTDDTQKPKFSATFIFAAGTDLKDAKAAVRAAANKKWGGKADDMIRSGKLHLPFRTDGEQFGYPEGSVFVGARSDAPPGVVSRYKDPATGKPTVVTKEQQTPGNPNELYAGSQVRGLLSAFAYDTQGNKGVSFGLNGIQKVGEGQRLDNRVAAEDAFEADLSEAPASLDDLM
jgi:hypothetical protein